jgi:hypothetical protein
LEERLQDWVEGLDAGSFSELLDPLVTKVLEGSFRWVGGDEGTVWLVDAEEDNLIAVFNSGPHSRELIGHQQPLGRGIISLVYANEQPYCENEIAKRESHDDTVDRKLGTETGAMIAVPFYFAFGLRGVISCVQLTRDNGDEKPAPGFDTGHVEEISAAVTVVERMINGRLLATLIGLDHV